MGLFIVPFKRLKGVPPKWKGYRENPIKMDDDWVYPMSGMPILCLSLSIIAAFLLLIILDGTCLGKPTSTNKGLSGASGGSESEGYKSAISIRY